MISVIVSIYKDIDNLELILMALGRQSFKDFEVIVSEDNNSPLVVGFLEKQRLLYPFTIKHTSQEDIGFRKCKALNESLRQSVGEKIVFIDGDCIPHKHLVREYNKNIQKGNVCTGRRVMLSEALSIALKRDKTLSKLSIYSLIKYKCRLIKYSFYIPFITNNKVNKRGLLGCNWGILKKHLLSINGFDEDYSIIGVGEDNDIEWRLLKEGIPFRYVAKSCLVYHIFHKERYNYEIVKPNYIKLEEKQKMGLCYCLNGINKSL